MMLHPTTVKIRATDTKQAIPQTRLWNSLLLTMVTVGILLLGAPRQAAAQQITATIVGTVHDPSGAVIPASTVKITNIDTGLVQSVTTNDAGDYRAQYLPVGNYRVEVAAAGFKKYLQKNIVLTVDQTQRVDVALTLGEATDTVTVTDTPPLVNTSTAEIGRTVMADEITQLPLPNRNVYTQLSLTPGVLSSSASTASGGNGASYNSVVGLPSTQVIIGGGFDGGVGSVSFYLDGGINMTGIRNYGNPAPNPDALQEFRVETNNYGAAYGRYGSGVVSLVTRSGTNAFHGSLFEFVRNTSLNDTPWGAPNNPLTGSKLNQPLHRNQFGGSIGGPIIKDKTFFFFSYAGLRQILDILESGSIVPTSLERVGDFTQSPTEPFQPATCTAKPCAPGTFLKNTTPYKSINASNNCQTATTGCMPSSAFDPTANAILNAYVPTGNVAHNVTIGKGLPNAGAVVSEMNGWAGYFRSPYNNNEYLGKVDHQFSQNNHLSVSYFQINSSTTVSGGGALLWSGQTDSAKQKNLNISDTQILHSGLINQTWFTYTRNFGGRANAALPPINGSTTPVDLSSFGSSYALQGQPSLPQVTVTNYFTLGQSIEGPTAGSNFYSLRDVASKTIGKHSLDVGAEMSLDKDIQITDLNNYGVFSFTTSAPETTENGLSDFLTGNPASMEQDTNVQSATNSWYYAFFAQDNFRATPKLTLNLGLRYDFQTPPTDNSLNRESTFVAGQQSTVYPTAPTGMLFPGDPGVTKGTVELRFHHVSPRFGLAYDPFGDGKTSFRAGAGVFYGAVSGNEWNATSNFAPFALRQSGLTVTSLTNIYAAKLANGSPTSFPTGTSPFPYIFKPGAYPSNATFGALNEEGASLKFQWPLTYQFNMSVQRQLPGNASVMVAYVGSLSHDLPLQFDVNYDAWAPGATTTAANENSRRPYEVGKLASVLNLQSSQTASYHSLQVSATKRMSYHFTMSAFYVWGHQMWSAPVQGEANSATDVVQDFTTFAGEHSPTNTDLQSMASISGIWNLSYYSGPQKWLGAIVNGWQISPLVTLNSGVPINLASGADGNADANSTTDRPNYVAGQNPTLSPHRCRLCANGTASAWFNTAAFVRNAPGVPGGIGPGGADGDVARNSLRGPGYRDIDLGIFRSFKLYRETQLQVRAEASNAFNMVSLGNPVLSSPATVNASGVQTAAQSTTFGTITNAQGVPRQIQLGARLTF
jgi:hypothetical protein